MIQGSLVDPLIKKISGMKTPWQKCTSATRPLDEDRPSKVSAIFDFWCKQIFTSLGTWHNVAQPIRNFTQLYKIWVKIDPQFGGWWHWAYTAFTTFAPSDSSACSWGTCRHHPLFGWRLPPMRAAWHPWQGCSWQQKANSADELFWTVWGWRAWTFQEILFPLPDRNRIKSH